MNIRTTYTYPNAQIKELTVTNDRATAERLIERGFSLFTVPQMFGAEEGPIVLYREPGKSLKVDGAAYLREYERDAVSHCSDGGISCGQVNDNH